MYINVSILYICELFVYIHISNFFENNNAMEELHSTLCSFFKDVLGIICLIMYKFCGT